MVILHDLPRRAYIRWGERAAQWQRNFHAADVFIYARTIRQGYTECAEMTRLLTGVSRLQTYSALLFFVEVLQFEQPLSKNPCTKHSVP